MQGFPHKTSALHTHINAMKRREFLTTAGAAASLSVLPLSPVAAMPAATSVPATQVSWATLIARSQAKASPELIQQWLNVGPEQARAVMSELVRKNVLRAPVGGAAVAVDPMFASRKVPGARPMAKRIATKANEMVREWAEAQLDDEAPEEKAHETS